MTKIVGDGPAMVHGLSRGLFCPPLVILDNSLVMILTHSTQHFFDPGIMEESSTFSPSADRAFISNGFPGRFGL